MDEEMRLHLELEADDLISSGVPREDAWTLARVAFGGVERFKDEGRDARGVRLVDDLTQDARYGARQLRRSPGFAIAALVTLSLGIGAATAMHSMLRALFTKPFPFENLEQYVFVEQCGAGCRRIAIGNYVSVRDESRTLSDVTAMTSWAPTYRGPETTDVARAARVTGDFFRSTIRSNSGHGVT